MKILVDAFNLIYKFPDLELCMYEDRLDEAKDGLIQILSEVSSIQKDVEFILFVDGKKVKGDYETFQETRNGMEIYYSQEQEADDIIRGFIKENSHPNRLKLVTSDKKIIQFAKQFKVKCITSEIYSDMVRSILNPELTETPEGEEKPPVNSQDTDEWMTAFTQNRLRTR